MHIRSTAAFVIAGILLSACGGGSSMSPVPFTSFSAIQSNQPVTANGISKTVSAATLGVNNVTSTTVNGVDAANSAAQMTYTLLPSPPPMTAFSVTTPTSSGSWSTVDCATLAPLCTASNTNSTVTVVNALNPAVAWNYQSFGYWLVNMSSTSTMAGAMSFGNPTPTGAVPVSGTATYSGLSGGIYVDPGGNVFTHGAVMTSTVDFNARTILFSTTGTQVTPVTTGAVAPLGSTLNLTGSFTYGAGPNPNQFGGSVTAPAFPAGSTGRADGQFYGPTAQELGGVFSLKAPSGPQTMLGGFGGKQ
jgi:transferrin binding protein